MSGFDVVLASRINNDELVPDRLRRVLHVFSLGLAFRAIRVYQHANGRRFWHDLAQQIQSLSPKRVRNKYYACEVAARSIEACNQLVSKWVTSADKDDRYGSGRRFGGKRGKT